MEKSSWGEVLSEFFTHSDYLPAAEFWPGTLFSMEQILVCAVLAVLIGLGAVYCSKKSEAFQKRIYFWLWLFMAVSEPLIVYWDSYAGIDPAIDFTGALSLWPCSIFLYAAPFAIFGKGDIRKSATGYICTLGLLGGAVNFVYPATYLSRYSILSMAGFRTVFYHGAMVFVAITMILSGYHSFKNAKTKKDFILPLIPMLLVSIPANIANFIIPGADYMFFKLESFFFAPIGQALPDIATIPIVYILYFLIHWIPFFHVGYFEKKHANI